MTDGLVIRRLAAPDVIVYKALRDAVLGLHPSAFTSDAVTESKRSAASYAGRLSNEATCFTLGAFAGDSLIGALSCERDSRVKVQHIGHLVGMMVLPTFEGLGVGRALLARCLDRLQTTGGFELVTLSVTADNHRAIRLYERAGFERYGELPMAIRIGESFHAKRLMMLTLKRGPTVS